MVEYTVIPCIFSVIVLMLTGVNPKYILRNYMAEKAIHLATVGNFTEV